MGLALSVVDVTRSMSYCVAAVFLGMSFLRSSPAQEMEAIAAVSAFVSFVIPTHYVEGSTGVWWLYPLPAQIVRWLFAIR